MPEPEGRYVPDTAPSNTHGDNPVLMYVEVTMPPDGPPRHVGFCCMRQEAPEGLLLRAIAEEC
eukprot:1333053-Prorocentrum_lima.AAC.1